MPIRAAVRLIASPFVWIKCKALKLNKMKADTVEVFNRMYGTALDPDDYVVKASLIGGFNIYHRHTEGLLALCRDFRCRNMQLCTNKNSMFYPAEFASQYEHLFSIHERVHFRYSKKVEWIYSSINVVPVNTQVRAMDDEDVYNDIEIVITADYKVHEIRKEAYDFSCMYSYRIDYTEYPANTNVKDVFKIDNNFILKHSKG